MPDKGIRYIGEIRIYFWYSSTIEIDNRQPYDFQTELWVERMGENRKFRKCIKIVGVAGAVYGVFRYLLPLVTPFVFAWLTALVLKPLACVLAGRLRVRWRGRTFGVPVCVAGLLELAFFMGIAGILLYEGGRRLYEEAVMLADRFPWFVRQLDLYLTKVCRQVEGALSLRSDTMVCVVRDMIQALGNTVKQGVMPYVMGNSVGITKCFVCCCIAAVIYIIGVMLFLQEMDGWRERMDESLFQAEFARIKRLLTVVANAYLRTQGIIMLLTTAVCVTGFFLMGNSYYILTGVGIGILDALPVFGTGTILIPWTILYFFRGRWARGIWVFGIYLACYFLREVLEARLMGGKVGLTPLETLTSMYVGLQLFGIFGFLLGPLGLLLVKEFAIG